MAKEKTIRYRESRHDWYAKNAVRLRKQQGVWRSQNKEKRASYMVEWSRKQKQWFVDYKANLRCEICGYNKCPDALVFHHKDKSQKELDIAVAVCNFVEQEVIMREIAKCQVLCQNCHTEVHHKARLAGEKHCVDNLKKLKEQPCFW